MRNAFIFSLFLVASAIHLNHQKAWSAERCKDASNCLEDGIPQFGRDWRPGLAAVKKIDPKVDTVGGWCLLYAASMVFSDLTDRAGTLPTGLEGRSDDSWLVYVGSLMKVRWKGENNVSMAATRKAAMDISRRTKGGLIRSTYLQEWLNPKNHSVSWFNRIFVSAPTYTILGLSTKKVVPQKGRSSTINWIHQHAVVLSGVQVRDGQTYWRIHDPRGGLVYWARPEWKKVLSGKYLVLHPAQETDSGYVAEFTNPAQDQFVDVYSMLSFESALD